MHLKIIQIYFEIYYMNCCKVEPHMQKTHASLLHRVIAYALFKPIKINYVYHRFLLKITRRTVKQLRLWLFTMVYGDV